MRRGFTLLELLVTMGIMSMLGLAATSGYQALVRGMTERGVTASAAAIMRAARERAHVDRQHTAVFCYNRLLREPDPANDENGIAVGVIVAVRRTGRISAVQGRFLYDEFADLENAYEMMDDQTALARRKGMRLYKFTNARVSQMQYSIVADATYLDTDKLTYIPSNGSFTNAWMGAFYNLSQSDHEPSWRAGDGYGVEFAELQLPDGYIFGRDVPQDTGRISIVKVIDFDPSSGGTESVEVWSAKPDVNGMPRAWKRAGTVKSDDSSV